MSAIKANELLETDASIIVSELQDSDMDELRRITKRLTAVTDKPVILSSVSGNCVLLTCASESGLKMGNIVKEYAVGFGGKGGGRDDQAQVFFENLELMRNFIKIASIEVSKEK